MHIDFALKLIVYFLKLSAGQWFCMNRTKIKLVFHLATLLARHEAQTRIWHCDWLKLIGEKIRHKQVGTVPTFFSVRANKFA